MAAGGAERVALSVMSYLAEQGYSVDLLLLHNEGELLAHLPPSIRVVDLGTRRVRQAVGPIARYLREERPIALQASMWPLTTLAVAARFLARSDCRIVISDHAVLTQQYPGSRLLPVSARLTYRHADARIAVSRGVAEDIAGFTGLTLGDFDVINNPVAFPPEQPELQPAIEHRALEAWSGAEHRILNVGTLKYEKQQVMLVEAFACFAERQRDAALVIVGEGELRGAIEQRAAACGVSDRVVITGYRDDPWPYYRSATMFALASQQEGYGNVLIEALYSGLPIVSMDCPTGPREILAGGLFGSLVSERSPEALCDAMIESLSQVPDKPRLRARALELSGPTTLETYRETILGGLDGTLQPSGTIT